MSGGAIGVVGGKLIVAGGWNEGGGSGVQGYSWEFDDNTNRWKELPITPNYSTLPGGSIGGKLIVLHETTPTEYDPLPSDPSSFETMVFKAHEEVEVRDGDEEWMRGRVTDPGPPVVVKVNGWDEAHTWDDVRPEGILFDFCLATRIDIM